MQLVQRHPLAPPVGQRPHLLVRGEDAVEVRGARKWASWARSVSRCPPCADGSTSITRPSVVQSRLPDHRSPCSRAGGSGGGAYRSMSASTRSTRATSAAESAPRSAEVRRCGRRRRSANHSGQCGARRRWSAAATRCSRSTARRRSRRRPGASPPARDRSARPRRATAAPVSTHSSTSRSGRTAMTSGIPTPPGLGLASQRRPAASVSKNRGGAGASRGPWRRPRCRRRA